MPAPPVVICDDQRAKRPLDLRRGLLQGGQTVAPRLVGGGRVAAEGDLVQVLIDLQQQRHDVVQAARAGRRPAPPVGAARQSAPRRCRRAAWAAAHPRWSPRFSAPRSTGGCARWPCPRWRPWRRCWWRRCPSCAVSTPVGSAVSLVSLSTAFRMLTMGEVGPDRMLVTSTACCRLAQRHHVDIAQQLFIAGDEVVVIQVQHIAGDGGKGGLGLVGLDLGAQAPSCRAGSVSATDSA